MVLTSEEFQERLKELGIENIPFDDGLPEGAKVIDWSVEDFYCDISSSGIELTGTRVINYNLPGTGNIQIRDSFSYLK